MRMLLALAHRVAVRPHNAGVPRALRAGFQEVLVGMEAMPVHSVGTGGEALSAIDATLVRDTMLMQLLVDSGDGLVERPLQKCQMIFFTMMMCGGALLPLRRTADVLETAIEHSQHIVCRVCAE